ncbi:MAG: NAD-dependent epimerase/dehydratase family protein [Candidatus Bipolaricaulota bacterium]|nr:NAD-dependent epimerase/dehydratase family protein [Candidatus Bipolaricaulota bacterium]MDW8141256.1 NAD-dependent epimerase/dehydratase family protein [Candidatus Bipolaricaulota bacterium]
MAQIFLTGATGFIGRHLLPALIQANHHVRCLMRKTVNAKTLQHCSVYQGDLLQPQPWEPAIMGANTVIHLASAHRGTPELLHRTNAEGTAQLVALAERAGVHKFIYLSTLTAAPKPQWPYAYSTWLAEGAIQQSSLDYTIVRCSVIVGPGDPFLGGIIKIAQRWPVVPVIGDGQTRFQVLDVRDVVRCLLQIVREERFSKKLLSIGGPEALSYEEIVDRVLVALRVRKRKVHVPRRLTRWLVSRLEEWGVHTPFAPGHFLSRDHCAQSLNVLQEHFGFIPKTLRHTLEDAFAP